MSAPTSRCVFDEARYSQDQPRDDHGRFGSGDGEKASSSSEHAAAKAGHIQKAKEEKSAGNVTAAKFHTAAAIAHSNAEVDKALGGSDGRLTQAAQEGSRVANKLSDKAEADSIGAGMKAETDKEDAHGIKEGDTVKDKTGQTYTVSRVMGNSLASFKGSSATVHYLHATKVTKV